MELATPCFVFDKGIFINNIADLHREFRALFADVIVGYSFKTNNLPAVLSAAYGNGCYAEVVSDAEYELAKCIGFSSSKIIFNGPIKGNDCLVNAVENGAIINIDSWNELNMYAGLQKDKKKGVGLRVNIDIESYLPGQSVTGEQGGRFGFNYENKELHKAIEVCRRNGIPVDGLHMHVSSKTKSLDVFKLLSEMAVRISEKESLDLKYIDIGGGFFGGNDGGKAYKEYAKVIYEGLRPLKNVSIIIEPGASVVATAFSYIVSVVESKKTNRSRFVITDGTRIHIDPFFNKDRYDYSVVSTDNGENRRIVDQQIICGYTCMEHDRIMNICEKMELKQGDRIIFNTVGSYTLGFNMMFIRFLPRVYMKDDLEYSLVRSEWSVDEFLQKCIW